MADSVTDVQHLPTLLKAAGSNEQSISNPIILLTGEELVEWVAKSEWKQFGQWSLNINSEINSHPFFESSRIVRNQGNQLEGQGQAPDQGFSAAMDREFGTHLNRVNQKPASQRITYSVSDPKGIEKVNSSMVKNEVPTGIRPGGPKQPTVMQNMFPGIKTDFVSVKPETTFTNPLTENLPGSPIFPPRASLGDFVDYSGSLLGKERSMLNLQEGMSGSRVPDGTGNTQPSQIGESPLTLPEVMRSVENGEMSSAEKMDDQISENKVLRIRSDGKNGQILIQNSTSKSESSPAFSETPMPAGEKTGFKNSPGFSEQINREMTEKDHPTISALSTKPGEGGRSAFAAITHSSSHSPLSYAEQIEFINSLTKQLQMAVNRSQQEIILHLKPEHLGMVRICLKMKKDMLSGKVEIQNPEAYQLIHKHANELNQRLQELQVNVDKLEFELRDFSQKERSSQDREHFAAHLTARQDFEVGLEEKGMEGARRMSNRLMFANSTFEYIA
ncbi:MAG: hypothetical protein Kow0042_03190 [Calditrichia bacterium]